MTAHIQVLVVAIGTPLPPQLAPPPLPPPVHLLQQEHVTLVVLVSLVSPTVVKWVTIPALVPVLEVFVVFPKEFFLLPVLVLLPFPTTLLVVPAVVFMPIIHRVLALLVVLVAPVTPNVLQVKPVISPTVTSVALA